MNIGIWGDSITYGACDSEALGWVGRLRKTFLVDDSVSLYNFGICGDTSTDICKRFAVEAEAVNPARIILAVGINDSKFLGDASEHNVSLATYEENLAILIKQGKKYTNGITIVSATKVAAEWRSMRGSRFLNEEIEKFNVVMQRLAHKHGLTYIDVFETLDIATDLVDGLHPNAVGYQKMFAVIQSKLDWV